MLKILLAFVCCAASLTLVACDDPDTTADNRTAYAKGINGIVIDVAGLAPTAEASLTA